MGKVTSYRERDVWGRLLAIGKEGWGRLLATGKEWVGGERLLVTGKEKVGEGCKLQRTIRLGKVASYREKEVASYRERRGEGWGRFLAVEKGSNGREGRGLEAGKG